MTPAFDFQNCRVLVVGDTMLDVYYSGSVERISPEAPVPVVKTNSVKKVPGGAANVCKNIASLGGRATLLGFLGSDENSRQLAQILAAEGVANACPTTAVACVTKIRVISGHQQIVRVDFDSNPGDFTEADYSHLKEKLRELVPHHDLVVISDYAKGVCREDVCRLVMELAGETPVLVDPKHNSWTKYSGATLVKPNVKELSEAAGHPVANEDSAVEAAARELRARYRVGSVLVTRSDRGMTLVESEHTLHLATSKQEVFDVSGAGDTVLAVMALMLAAGKESRDAVHVANVAGGIVVGKLGTASVTPEELETRLSGFASHRKVVTLEQGLGRVAELRARGETVVFTNGCFDILHRGHLDYLRKARGLGSALIVGLNSDASTKRLKGPTRPINAEADRAEMLAALEFVDFVVLFEEDTPRDLIEAIRPDVLAKGGDYRVENIVGREFAGKTVVISFVDGYSTTKIVEKMRESPGAKA